MIDPGTRPVRLSAAAKLGPVTTWVAAAQEPTTCIVHTTAPSSRPGMRGRRAGLDTKVEGSPAAAHIRMRTEYTVLGPALRGCAQPHPALLRPMGNGLQRPRQRSAPRTPISTPRASAARHAIPGQLARRCPKTDGLDKTGRQIPSPSCQTGWVKSNASQGRKLRWAGDLPNRAHVCGAGTQLLPRGTTGTNSPLICNINTHIDKQAAGRRSPALGTAKPPLLQVNLQRII